MIIYDIDESYSIINWDDTEDLNLIMNQKLEIMDALSVFVDDYQFTPAYRAGVWDGKKSFYDLDEKGLKIFKGLVQSVISKFHKNLTKEYVPLSQVPQVNENELQEFIDTLDLPFQPRDYQFESVLKALNEGRKISVVATGSGKSLIQYIIMRWMGHHGKKGLLIVPNVGLAEQMMNDFREYNMGEQNMEDMVHLIYAGKPKHFDKLMTISTWQSTYKEKHLFEPIEYILIDECHLAKAESLQGILASSKNCKYKLGFTGTLPKSYVDRFTLTATLGKSEVIINAQGLIERGYATPVNLILMYLNYDISTKKDVKKMKYPQETKYIEEHYNRNNFVAKVAVNVAKTYGNTLVLYNTIKHGEFLLELVLKNKFGLDNIQLLEKVTPMRLEKISPDAEKIFTVVPLTEKDKRVITKVYGAYNPDKWDNLSKYHIYLIKGDIEGPERNKIRAYLEELDDAILIASFGTSSTGMNVKRLNNIILTSSTKSPIRLGQSIGRGMRLHGDKDKLRIFDVIDDFSTKTKTGKIWNKNYALKHSYERMEAYFSYGYPILEKEVHIDG